MPIVIFFSIMSSQYEDILRLYFIYNYNIIPVVSKMMQNRPLPRRNIFLCPDLPCAGCAHGTGSVPDPLVHAGDELDEGFVEVPPHRSCDPGAEGLRGPPEDLRLPCVEGRLQGAGETAHAMDVSEELLVCHVGVLRHFSCRLPTLIKLSRT